MKIRLIKKNINKAVRNRGHLVKVAKQIQGQTGAYQSHRWINPNKAIEVLKDSIGVKGEVFFTDKNSGEQISEKELLKEYQENGKNTTIQDYVKNKYKISSKQTKSNTIINADEPQSKTDNEEIPESALPILDIEYPEFTFTKIDKRKIKVEPEENNYRKGSTFKKLKLPKLEGSEEEIAQAEKLRERAINIADEYVEELGEVNRYGKYNKHGRLDAQKFYTTLKEEKDASYYIGLSEHMYEDLSLARRMSMYYDNSYPIDKSINFHYKQMKKYNLEQKKKEAEIFNESLSENEDSLKGGLRPEKLNGVPRNKPMTFEQADKQSANPRGFTKDAMKLGYLTNCQTAVAVFEARLRGYDLESLPNTKGSVPERLSRETHSIWLDPTTGNRLDFVDIILSAKTKEQFLQKIEDTIQVGERYHLVLQWKNSREGHIVTAYKNKDNEVIIYDPQVNEFTQGKKELLDYIAKAEYNLTNNALYRVDNKIFDERWIEGISRKKLTPTKGLILDTQKAKDAAKAKAEKEQKDNHLKEKEKEILDALDDETIGEIKKLLEPLYKRKSGGAVPYKRIEAENKLTETQEKINKTFESKESSKDKEFLQGNMDALFRLLKSGQLTLEQAMNHANIKVRGCAYLLIMAMLEDDDVEGDIESLMNAML